MHNKTMPLSASEHAFLCRSYESTKNNPSAGSDPLNAEMQFNKYMSSIIKRPLSFFTTTNEISS